MYGTNVTLYLANQAALNMSGSTQSQLTAPSTGVLAGFVVFGDGSGNNLQSQLSGSVGAWFNGIVYLPKQQISLSGSSSNTVPPYTAYVADTVSLSGSSTIQIGSDTSTFGSTIPTSVSALSGSSSLRLTN